MGLTITIEELGDELVRRRKEHGLSLRDVEEATGVSATTLSRVERGSTPDLEIVSRLAKWLEVVVHTAGKESIQKNSDADLKRTIEVHLRANKDLSPALAKSIADSFDFVMRVELERAAAKKKLGGK